MTLIKRYIGRTVAASIFVVLLILLSLESISALVNQLAELKGNYNFGEAVIFVLLNIPSNAYENLPMSALVGSLVGLGMLASTSELVVIRSAGVSILQIVYCVMRPVFLFVLFGVFLGEFVSPTTDQYAQSRQALAKGVDQPFDKNTGVWNKEGNEYMHFNAVLPNGKLYGVTRYIFDENQKLLESSYTKQAIYQGAYWFESDGSVSRFKDDAIELSHFDSRKWQTEVSPDLLNVLVLDEDQLPMSRLFDYANYLDNQGLESGEYKLAFWEKAFMPLAMISLVIIAISFIMGSLRQTTMGYRVFIGVLVGLVFQTSQKMLGPASILVGFSPLLAVLVPIIICFLVGLFLIRKA